MTQSKTLELYDRIRDMAPDVHRAITEAARRAHNEAEFERDVNNVIDGIAADLGVQLLFRQQYTLATGRADAVYNRFIIEYEPPDSLRSRLSHGHTAHAVQQVRDYIEGLAKEERHDRDRLLGVAFDGHYYIYVRYHEGHFITEDPVEANTPATERFLRSLFSLSSGRALIPENLVEDFGSENILAHRVTRSLYNALEREDEDSLAAKLYAQWLIFFGETAGSDALTGKLRHKSELQKFVRGMGLKPGNVDAPRFFFAIHTYFSFLVKNIARLVLQAFAAGAFGTTPLTTIAQMQGETLKRELQQMESGGIFRTLGLKNLLEGDFFSWYLDAWDEEIEDALRQVLQRLADYNPVTIQDDPYSARDLLKKLYHYLLPRDIRHDLGEYYTPDWLATRLLNQLNEPLFRMPDAHDRPTRPDKRLLDPACGSGTFLILAAGALKANCVHAGLAEGDTLERILDSVVGIDLNPLAVLAARVNYLLAIADLIPYRRTEIEIPVYLADSILTPARGKTLFEHDRLILETAVGKLPVPAVIDSRSEMDRLTDLLEEYIHGDFSAEAFLQRCEANLPDVAANPSSKPILRELFEHLYDLHQKGLDGIWARVLKNAFMPLFLEPFDYVVGNPPWINWETLPQGYRDQVAPLWEVYGLFGHSGFDAILGKAKDDISALMTYVAVDRYLKSNGRLAFVITQSLWKSSGGGQGFRRFQYSVQDENVSLRVLHVDDMSNLSVFEGATTRPSVFVLQKNQSTRYPVPYTVWAKRVQRMRLDYNSTLEDVLDMTRRLHFEAVPVSDSDRTSPWVTARRNALSALQRILDSSDYRARAGTTTWANAAYWFEVATRRADGRLIARNVTEGSRKSMEAVTVELEPDLLYPLLRGRDLSRWHANPTYHLLLTHREGERLQAISEKEMQLHYPKTWSYLKRFETLLRGRSGFTRFFTRKDRSTGEISEKGPFYSIFNVGDYTFAPWKVVWREVSSRFEPAVIGTQAGKPIIPDHTVVLIPCNSEEEAHYICCLLASTLYRLAINSYFVLHPSPHVMSNVKVPKYDPEDALHVDMARLSQRAHEIAKRYYEGEKSIKKQLTRINLEVDETVAAYWGMSPQEMVDVRTSFEEIMEN